MRNLNDTLSTFHSSITISHYFYLLQNLMQKIVFVMNNKKKKWVKIWFFLLSIAVLRSGERDWQCRGRPSPQQYSHSSVNPWLWAGQDETPGASPSFSLPTPPPPPKSAPPPPPPRPPRRSVTFADSPLKTPPRHQQQRRRSSSTIATLDVAVPWTPPTPGHWPNRTKAEYIT